jgi:hypothetical protein
MSQHRESNAVCHIVGRGKQIIDHSQCSLIIHGDTHQSMNLRVALTCLSVIGERVNTDLTCNMESFKTLMLVTLASICDDVYRDAAAKDISLSSCTTPSVDCHCRAK